MVIEDRSYVTTRETRGIHPNSLRNTQLSVREYQGQLRDIRQELIESVQSYNKRFRKAFNKLQYAVNNEYRDEIISRAMNDRLIIDTVTDYI